MFYLVLAIPCEVKSGGCSGTIGGTMDRDLMLVGILRSGVGRGLVGERRVPTVCRCPCLISVAVI